MKEEALALPSNMQCSPRTCFTYLKYAVEDHAQMVVVELGVTYPMALALLDVNKRLGGFCGDREQTVKVTSVLTSNMARKMEGSGRKEREGRSGRWAELIE